MAKRNSNLSKLKRKNQAQYSGYRNFLSSPTPHIDDTYPNPNKYLQGTADSIEEENDSIDNKSKIKPKSLRFRIIDWIRQNVLTTVICSIIVAIGTATLFLWRDSALLEQRVEYIEKQIESIDSNCVDKELLELQLEQIKTEMKSSFAVTNNNLEWRIQNLEELLKELQNDDQPKLQ